MLKKGLIIIVLLLAGLALGKYIYSEKQQGVTQEQATIIKDKVKNISKLMVVEGNFSEIYTYRRAEKFFNLIPLEKKMIVLVNAKALVGYDLEQLDIQVLEDQKKIVIGAWPEADIIIEPDVQYYDIQQSEFYKFNEQDLTKINNRAVDLIRNQVEDSDLEDQARERAEEVLENLIFMGSTMGWSVSYEVPELKPMDQPRD